MRLYGQVRQDRARQGIQPREEYLDIVLKVGWLISLRISNRNRILKTYKTDCVSIAVMLLVLLCCEI